MLLSLMADVHVGNHRVFGGETSDGINVRCALTLGALRRAMDRGVAFAPNEEDMPDAAVIVGDLLDVAEPAPAVLHEVASALHHGPDRVVLVVGNHDRVGGAHHAMLPLTWVHNVDVIDGDRGTDWSEVAGGMDAAAGGVVVGMPTNVAADAAAGGAIRRARNLLGAVPAADPAHVVLALHYGVEDGDTPAYLRGASDAVRAADLEKLVADGLCGWVVAGNWHDRKTWAGGRVIQLGSLAPTGFADLSHDHGVTFLDTSTERVTFAEIPGPRFVSGTLEEADTIRRKVDHWVGRRCDVGVQIQAPPARLAEAREFGRKLEEEFAGSTEDETAILGVRVVAARKAVAQRVRRAASAARAAGSLDEAVAAFVERNPPPEVPADNVVEAVRGYLRGVRG